MMVFLISERRTITPVLAPPTKSSKPKDADQSGSQCAAEMRLCIRI